MLDHVECGRCGRGMEPRFSADTEKITRWSCDCGHWCPPTGREWLITKEAWRADSGRTTSMGTRQSD